MKNLFIKAFGIFTLSTFSILTTQSFAADTNIEVTPIQEVTQHELAAIYVLSEICPGMVKDQNKFKAGYRQLVSEYMPGQKNPVEALNQLSKNTKFQPILKEAQQDAQKAGQQKNQAICTELTTYSKS
ncbi:MCR_0457 family protein [Acinetobacter schindleri]|uniref:MCR_0457 family protein n=1 Tax=Acinetobacter schindleri TaxID=108981 RepID=UPI00241E1D36|nr:hypothetical protein [Acinetobacter schindleri]